MALFLTLPEQCIERQMIHAHAWTSSEVKDPESMEHDFVWLHSGKSHLPKHLWNDSPEPRVVSVLCHRAYQNMEKLTDKCSPVTDVGSRGS